ncbi:MAG: radical SAM protein [Nitrospirae bacterium]|nr:radical SAM protein [Nitrospirota bacterium]
MYSPFRFIPHVFRKKPVHLTFFVTRKCNQKCPFCFYLSRSKEARNPLTFEEIEKISSSFGTLLWVSFSGGEVFLKDNLVDITKVFYKNTLPSILLYPTNGMMPEIIKNKTEEILRHCKKSTVVLKLSLDGLNEKHDLLRGVSGSFQKLMETLGALAPLLSEYPNFELGINTVFCSANEDDMDELISFVMGLEPIKTHTISLIRGNVKDNAYKAVDIEKYLRASMRLEENLKNKKSPIYRFHGSRVKSAQDILQRRLIYRTVTEDSQIIPCYAGRLNVTMTEEGEVFPCEEFDYKIGNIRDSNYDIKTLLKSPEAKKIISDISKNKCHCSHECYMMTNILFNLRKYPELLKEYLQV